MSTESEESKSNANPKQLVGVSFQATTPVSILIESLVQNLCAMFESDEERAKAVYASICHRLFEMRLIDESYQMREFEGVRGQYQRALYHLVALAREHDAGDAAAIHRFPDQRILNENFLSDWSHYCREFDELNYIAGGGFGHVYRVRHKLDSSEYAVKKIFIRSNRIKSVMKYLKEVKTFASLNHSNVVQYKAAWLELGVPQPSQHKEIRPVCSADWSVQFESHTDGDSSLSTSSSSDDGISKDRRLCQWNRMNCVQRRKWATLYIQMSLCDRTLKQWLDERNRCAADLEISTVDVLRQLLAGLQYIHARGVVHHDVKPSNVFLQVDAGSLRVQLGDFGLACPLQNTEHTLALGTKLYAAPEQLAGKCHAKSDMYSLGIVLLELVESFQTDMERIQQIVNLRKGHLSSQILAEQPLLATMISQLVRTSPDSRPSASQLLERLADARADDSDQIRQLKAQLAEKDNEIQRLRAIIQAAGLHTE